MPARRPQVEVAPRQDERPRVEREELRVVGQHLLEVRQEPVIVGRIPVKAAGEVIVDAAEGHLVERLQGHRPGDRVPLGPLQEEPLERQVRRELRRAAEAAVPRVERPLQRRRQDVSRRGRERLAAGPLGDPVRVLDLGDDLVGSLRQLVAPLAPRLGELLEDGAEPGTPLPVLGREVGAAEERASVGKEERRERPAAPPDHRLHRAHVDVVDVGPLLAVDLHGDVVLVQDSRQLLVLERLPLHDVTPVARRVADGKEQRLVLAPRLLERLRPPRVPVDRVVRVLAQVRGRLLLEPVRGTGGIAHAPDSAVLLLARAFPAARFVGAIIAP